MLKNNFILKNNLSKEGWMRVALFSLIFVFAYGTNIANITFGDVGSNPGELVMGATLGSPDNFWYLSQIKNFMAGFGFTVDPDDLIQSVRRTPGYPLFYGLHYFLFGEYSAHHIIRISQCLLFAFSALVLGSIASSLSSSKRIGYVVTLAYGTSPYLTSFLFMTITEAISPAFVILSAYFFYNALFVHKRKLLWFFLAGFFISIATLIRPTNGLLGLSFGLCLVMQQRLSFFTAKKALVMCLGFFLLIVPWTIRNYTLTGLFVPLETFTIQIPYDGQGLKSYGLNAWFRSWTAHDTLRIHYGMKSDLETSQRHKTIDNFLAAEVPGYVYSGYDQKELRDLLIEYQDCIELESNATGGRRLRWGEKINDCEYSVNNRFLKLRDLVVETHPLLSYVIAPFFLRGSQYIFHSGLHTYKSMQGSNLSPIRFVIKSYAYLINVILWFSFFAYLFMRTSWIHKAFLGIFVLVSFCFITQYSHVEGRYLLAVYPFLYLTAVLFMVNAIRGIRRMFKRTTN